MRDRLVSDVEHPEDLPWNDLPADEVAATDEPAPGEIVERDGEVVDLAWPAIPDPYEKYRRESLDERLDEEEPDAPGSGPEGG